MNFKEKIKNKKGIAIEWAIIFGVVVVAFMGIALVSIKYFAASNRLYSQTISYNAELDQVGEYFLRAVGTRTGFPTVVNDSTDTSSYPWMDATAKQFLKDCCEKYNFRFVEEYCSNSGTFWNFYRAEGGTRRLTVKQGDNSILSVAVGEKLQYEEQPNGTIKILTTSANPKTTFEIVEWTEHDALGTLTDDGNFLTNLWHLIGQVFNQVDENTTTMCVVRYENDGNTRSTYSYTAQGSTVALTVLPDRDTEPSIFDGWNVKEISTNTTTKVEKGATYTVNTSIVCTPVWKVNQSNLRYNVSFWKNDGTNTVKIDENVKSSALNTSHDYYWDGYTWQGWAETAGGSVVSQASYPYGDNPETNKSFYAVWSKNTYSVTCSNVSGISFQYQISDANKTIAVSYNPGAGKSYYIKNPTKGTVDTNDRTKLIIPANTTGDITFEIGTEDITYTIKTTNGDSLGTYKYKSGEKQEFSLPKAPSGNDSQHYSYALYSPTTGLSIDNDNCKLTVNAGTSGNIQLARTLAGNGYSIEFTVDGKTITGKTEYYNFDSSSSHTKTLTQDGLNIPTNKRFSSWKITTNSTGATSSISGNTLTIPKNAKGNIVIEAVLVDAYTITIKGYSSGDKTDSYAFSSSSSQTRTLTQDGLNIPTNKRFSSWKITTNSTGATSSISGNTLTIPKNAKGNIVIEAVLVDAYTITIKNEDDSVAHTESYNKQASEQKIYLDDDWLTIPEGKEFSTWSIETNPNNMFSIKKSSAQLIIPANATGDITVKAVLKDKGCFAAGTLITMADGTQKPIEELKIGDLIRTWNFVTGEMEIQPISMYWNHGWDEYTKITLHFENNTDVNVLAKHGFFDCNENKFIFIDGENCQEYVGHKFAVIDQGGQYYSKELLSASVTIIQGNSYSLRTAYNDNAFAEGLLSLTIEDFDGITTTFAVGDNMKYDEQKLQQLVDKYGYYSYEQWSQYMPEYIFDMFNCKYYKIYVGLGILTEDDFYSLLDGLYDNLNGE